LKSQFTMHAMLLTLTDHSQRLQFRKNYRHVIQIDPGDTSTSDSPSSDDSKPTMTQLTDSKPLQGNRVRDQTPQVN
jgi:hypothetical protein